MLELEQLKKEVFCGDIAEIFCSGLQLAMIFGLSSPIHPVYYRYQWEVIILFSRLIGGRRVSPSILVYYLETNSRYARSAKHTGNAIHSSN
jgi:hypothetical protein